MDEMTLGELARALARIEDRQKEQATQYVPMQVYTLEIGSLRAELVEQKADLAQARQESKEAEKQRIVDRRWWITAIAIPTALFLLNTILPILTGSGAAP